MASNLWYMFSLMTIGNLIHFGQMTDHQAKSTATPHLKQYSNNLKQYTAEVRAKHASRIPTAPSRALFD